MFLVAGFILSPQAVTNLRATAIGLNDRDTPSPIVLGRILRLAVPLLRKCRLLIGFDASVLFVETFVADPDRDALALFGWDRQIGEVVKIATGDLVRTITSRSDGDFLEDCWCLGLIDITAENFELREKNRGGKPRNERHPFGTGRYHVCSAGAEVERACRQPHRHIGDTVWGTR